MHVTMVHIRVKPDCIAAFIAAARHNHAASVQEPGNRRFDVLQDPNDSSHFLLYEGFTDADAVAAHKETPHYLAWRETVSSMMAEPRQGVAWTCLAPE